MEGIAIIILAAGKGTRMKSEMVKVLHPILGAPMLSYSIGLSLNGIQAEKTIVVVGYQADQIIERFKNPRIQFALQKEQLGTGHAALQAIPFLKAFTGTALILCGDVPLVRADTLRSFIGAFAESSSILAVLTTVVVEPFGYGRILRSPEGWLEKIVEEKDASENERSIREINTGIYCVKVSFLTEGLGEIGKDNAQSEYYLTDLVGIARKKGLRCSAHVVSDPVEVMGINTRVDLAVQRPYCRFGIPFLVIELNRLFRFDNVPILVLYGSSRHPEGAQPPSLLDTRRMKPLDGLPPHENLNFSVQAVDIYAPSGYILRS